MDKKYKLTDRVSKDSIKSPIFKMWVKRILCIACIFSLALQLTLCCLPMQVSAAESIVGTWVFHETLDLSTDFVAQVTYTIPNYPSGADNTRKYIVVTTYMGNKVLSYSNTGSLVGYVYNEGKSPMWYEYDINGTINITNADNVSLEFITWLKANATKVVEYVYDFTGETRIFNDELTLFNTSDATWTEAFAFNFEVLGVGTADYIILQRTVQNKYTMSYSFDFEDSGGLTTIYRDSPPFDNGEAEWLGGKVNRKVIKFLSNPENPDFQQWLLDNTTLFDDVNAAYQLGQQSGYNNGYEEGFANSLIGDSLSGPINALSQITLIEIQGTAITLGGVVMTAIALCLVLAFLKLYAGG